MKIDFGSTVSFLSYVSLFHPAIAQGIVPRFAWNFGPESNLVTPYSGTDAVHPPVLSVVETSSTSQVAEIPTSSSAPSSTNRPPPSVSSVETQTPLPAPTPLPIDRSTSSVKSVQYSSSSSSGISDAGSSEGSISTVLPTVSLTSTSTIEETETSTDSVYYGEVTYTTYTFVTTTPPITGSAGDSWIAYSDPPSEIPASSSASTNTPGQFYTSSSTSVAGVSVVKSKVTRTITKTADLTPGSSVHTVIVTVTPGDTSESISISTSTTEVAVVSASAKAESSIIETPITVVKSATIDNVANPSDTLVASDPPANSGGASSSPMISSTTTSTTKNVVPTSSASTTTSISPSSSYGSSSLTPTSCSKSSRLSTRYRGFNIINNSRSRLKQAKDAKDWAEAIEHMKRMSSNFNAIRMYSVADGGVDHLERAMPAIISHNISVHVGVWSGGDSFTDRFEDEKTRLDKFIAKNGCNGFAAVSIGNEDMYSRQRTDVAKSPLADIGLLVKQVQEIQAVLDKHHCCDVPVTHTDTFGQWLNTNFSEPLIRQVDFLTINIFPYWEGVQIESAAEAFWDHLGQTREMAKRYGKKIWIGETGWPVRGPSVEAAIPSPENLQTFWKQVGCRLMQEENAFWYIEWDDEGDTKLPFGITSNLEKQSNLGCDWTNST